MDIRCTTVIIAGTRTETQAYGSPLLPEGYAMDPDAAEIAAALADALPEGADRRDEIVAVGMLATALISGTAAEDRAELVESFCETLRRSICNEMN